MSANSKRIVTGATLGLAMGGFIAISGRFDAATAAAVAILPIAILILPACITHTLGHLTRLAGEFDISFVPWILLFLSGLVFRARDTESIHETPLDAWALFRVAGVVLAFLLMAGLFIGGKCSVRSLYRGLPALLIACGLIGAASTAWSMFPSWTLYKSLEYAVDVAVLAGILSVLHTMEDLKRLFDWTWVLLFGLLFSVWLGALIWPEEALEHGVGLLGLQLSGVFPSVAANGVGELAGLLGLVCLARIIYSQHKVCYSAIFACCCGTMILSQTRSALAGFACGGLSILIATKRYLSAIAVVAVGALVLSSSSADGFWTYIRRGQDNEMFTSLSGRANWWTLAIQKVKERPLLGYGAYGGGRFVVLNQFGPPEASSVHNDYLEILLGTGVIGLSVAVIAVTGVWREVLRASRRPTPSRLERELAVEALAILTLLMVRSMFSTALFWHPPLPFLLIVGYAEILRQRGSRRLPAFSDYTYARAGSIQLAEFHLQKS